MVYDGANYATLFQLTLLNCWDKDLGDSRLVNLGVCGSDRKYSLVHLVDCNDSHNW